MGSVGRLALTLTFTLMTMLLFETPAHAQTLNPNDDVSVEVRSLVTEALGELRSTDPDIVALLSQVEAELPNLNAYLTDESLVALSKTGLQNSLAVNYPDLGLVLFNRARWSKIVSRDLKRAIALHETMSIMKLERTGVYLFSSAYLALSGLNVGQLVSALEGRDEAPVVVSCQWTGDRMHLDFEVWMHSYTMCEDQTPGDGSFKRKERRLREDLDLINAKCAGDRKLLSTSAKIATYLGAKKPIQNRLCGL